MTKKLPPLALIWMYQGKDVTARLARISEFVYPDFQVFQVRQGHGWSKAVKQVAKNIEICVFWIDDGKPITDDFLEKMTLPIIAPKQTRAAMHFWSGHAMSIARSLVDRSHIEDAHNPTTSLLKLLLPILDVADMEPHGRVHVAFSSTERLAPITMDPVGIPS